MGTFRTYTLKIEGNAITLKNLTIENNSARLGQAVALHTEGDRLLFINCRFIGHQDTIYTGVAGTRLYFKGCYICGTTDFIFGPSIAWFEDCTIESLVNSYVTAASTPKDQAYGYIFNNCRLIAKEGVDQVYLGRPWRDYGYTLFMNCELGGHIRPEGWHHWEKQREQTARYLEYNNRGEGAKNQGPCGLESSAHEKGGCPDYTRDRIFCRFQMESATINPKANNCMKKLLITIVCVATSLTTMAQQRPLWLRYSAISPDGKTIVFSYKETFLRFLQQEV